jgi:hypothetical protein
MAAPLTILCLASYHKHKGIDLLRELRRQDCTVLLVTSKSLEDAEWPRDSIDEIFYMPDTDKQWDARDTLLGISHLARSRRIDRIVPLDDFDLEKAAAVREHLRVPGMGESQTRFFRDARDAGTRVTVGHPGTGVRVVGQRRPGAGVRRARHAAVDSQASVDGRHHRHPQAAQRRRALEHGSRARRSAVVLPARAVCGGRHFPRRFGHVEGRVVRAVVSRYGTPPFTVSHGGGAFTTRLVERGSTDDRALQSLSAAVLSAFGLHEGVSHTEYIRAVDGTWYFLETSARVGGAHIADLVEVPTGANFWAEWAKIEAAAARGASYAPPADRGDYAGLIVSLARQEQPDTSAYIDAEIVWRLSKRHHVGLIVRSRDQRRVEELLDRYTARFTEDFVAAVGMRAFGKLTRSIGKGQTGFRLQASGFRLRASGTPG